MAHASAGQRLAEAVGRAVLAQDYFSANPISRNARARHWSGGHNAGEGFARRTI